MNEDAKCPQFVVMGQYQKAIESHRKHLEIAEELGDIGGVAKAHGNMGTAYHNIGQYESAIECHRKHLEIAEELGDKGGVGKAHTNLGTAYHDIGQYQKAIECHRKHLEIAEELGDKGGVGKAHANLGNAYFNIGQYQKAIECHCKHLEIAEELGDKDGVGGAHANLGNDYHNIGQYQRAIDCHRKHLEIAEELGDIGGVAKAHGNMGTAYHNIGQYESAIECHRKHLEIAEELGDKDGVGGAHANLGNDYHNIGQYQRAIDCHRKHLEIAEELGDIGGVAKAHGNMGTAYHNIGQYESAIECHRKHLEIAEELGDKGGVGKAHTNLGTAYHDIGQYQKAIECHRKHLEIAEELGDKGGVGKTLTNLGRCYYCLRQYQKAIAFVRKSLQISEEIGDIRGKVIAEDILGLCHQKDDDCLSSSFFAQSILSFHSIHYGIYEDENNTSLLNVLNDIHKSLFLNLLNLKQVKAALLISDAGKAKALFDLTKRCVDVVLDSALEDNYTIPIQAISEDPSSKTTEECLNDVLSKVINLTVQDGSIISYTFDRRNNLHAWVVSKKGVFHKEWKTVNGMSTKTYFRTTCDDAARDTNIGTFRRKQYSVLISPIEEYLVGSKILIAPEGSLFRVPFCALLNSKNEHLCEKYSLQFTPALHVLNACISKPLPKLGPALFVGNPIVGKVEFQGQLLSPVPLPYATVEAKECSKFFGTEPLLEENATKENVLKIMKDASVIHIAAHGDMDNVDIFLAPNEGAPKPPSEEHYLLTAKDVTKCTLVARLVVLSCCHSGRGQISAEGVVGIARSFLGAGARSVLVTICRIPDEATMIFMKDFYDKVVQGLSVCVALQRSMIELKKKYPISAWAPFQIVGEDIALSSDGIEEIRQLSSIRYKQ